MSAIELSSERRLERSLLLFFALRTINQKEFFNPQFFAGKRLEYRLAYICLDVIEHVDGEEFPREMILPLIKLRAIQRFDFGDAFSKLPGQVDYEATAWPFEFFAMASCSSLVYPLSFKAALQISSTHGSSSISTS